MSSTIDSKVRRAPASAKVRLTLNILMVSALFSRGTRLELPGPYREILYESAKTVAVLNQYIKSEFPRNYQVETQPEPDLPESRNQPLLDNKYLGVLEAITSTIPKPADEFRIFWWGAAPRNVFTSMIHSRSRNRSEHIESACA